MSSSMIHAASLLLAAIIIPCIISADGDFHWSYAGSTGPDHWAKHVGECGAQKQSPINFVPADALLDVEMGPARYTAATDAVSVIIENNGHAAKVEFKEPTLNVSGMGLPGTYAMVQMHFHHRSEHTVNGKHYPLELHMVCYNTKYSNISEALHKGQGLAVLGVFFEEKGAKENIALKPIVDSLSSIKYKEQKKAISSFSWTYPGVLNKEVDNFDEDLYRYSGSLTTPPCAESVVWTVYRNPLPISSDQLSKFNSLMYNSQGETDQPMVDNLRPVQPLNRRTVKRTFTTGGATRPILSVSTVIMFAAIYYVI